MNISVFEIVAWVQVKGSDSTFEQATTLVSAETMDQVWKYIKSHRINETSDIESIRCLGLLSHSLVSPTEIGLAKLLSRLNNCVHSGYDFNADPLKMSLLVGDTLRPYEAVLASLTDI
mgnify:FL=1